jgi:hypothetical protein
MKRQEQTRERVGGTHVTNPADQPDAGLARIAAVRRIVEEHQYAKIDGQMVDAFSASAIVAIYDALSAENQAKYRGFHVALMADMAFKLLKKYGK